MNNVQSATSFEQLGLSFPKTETGARNKLGQEQFLKLMVAQLKHQDPTKPLDNAEFLSQIAQFSTVTGIQELQSSFTQLAGSMQSNQLLQTSTLVGRSVLVESDLGTLPAGGNLGGAVRLSSSTPELMVTIQDARGAIVRRLEMGTQAAGQVRFNWDGIADNGQNAPPGVYRVKAEASVDGKTVALDTLTAASVESVTLDKATQALSLNLAGLGPVAFSKVRQIL